MKRKYNSHLTIKWEDIFQSLDNDDQIELARLRAKVQAYRKACGKDPEPSYLICNRDEPYADKVLDVIRTGEDAKENSENEHGAEGI